MADVSNNEIKRLAVRWSPTTSGGFGKIYKSGEQYKTWNGKTFVEIGDISSAVAEANEYTDSMLGVNVQTQDVATAFEPDRSLYSVFNLTLTANTTIASMANAKDGDSGSFRIIQDATGGSGILGDAAFYKFLGFVVGDLDTTASTYSLVEYKIVLGKCYLELIYTGEAL